jgi:hypothetical protein
MSYEKRIKEDLSSFTIHQTDGKTYTTPYCFPYDLDSVCRLAAQEQYDKPELVLTVVENDPREGMACDYLDRPLEKVTTYERG